MTEDEMQVLGYLRLRPSGAPIRSEGLKAAVLTLAARQLACDPHTIGAALFTRITEEGKAAFATNADFDPADHPDAGGPSGGRSVPATQKT